MHKKILAAIILAVVTAVTLCGCSSNALKGAKPITSDVFAQRLTSLGFTADGDHIITDSTCYVWRDDLTAYAYYTYATDASALIAFNDLTNSYEKTCRVNSMKANGQNKVWTGENDTMCYIVYRIDNTMILGQAEIFDKKVCYDNVNKLVKG